MVQRRFATHVTILETQSTPLFPSWAMDPITGKLMICPVRLANAPCRHVLDRKTLEYCMQSVDLVDLKSATCPVCQGPLQSFATEVAVDLQQNIRDLVRRSTRQPATAGCDEVVKEEGTPPSLVVLADSGAGAKSHDRHKQLVKQSAASAPALGMSSDRSNTDTTRLCLSDRDVFATDTPKESAKSKGKAKGLRAFVRKIKRRLSKSTLGAGLRAAKTQD